ncbi:hypothetical protein P4E94_15720 [Pontiellaceae bacterium B12219]|nr:hypothetical protein [Pontiellaceae bacterium B12219]
MIERITIPIRPTLDTPSRLTLDYEVINNLHADQVSRLLRGAFGSALDVPRIRETLDQHPLSEKQVEAIKEATRLTAACLAGQFASDNARAARAAAQRERAAKEREEQEARREAARREAKAQRAKEQIDSLVHANEDDFNRLVTAILTKRDEKHGTEHVTA